uniref:SAM domain-containing protein n=1 Tax=Magallana gigas TaxID=29159 RepID=K1PAL0_MAGGI
MDDIKLILKNIDLPNLANNFAEANVNNVDICKSLSDVDLSRLGIATIGDRIRFREELRRSGRRGDVTLAKILRFCTGSEEEPPLGYQIQPTMEFVERQSFLPTGNTCINKMQLTIPVNEEPTEDALFNFFDFAFCNSYFGLQ